MHFHAVALNVTVYPELIGTGMLKIPDTSAERNPFPIGCTHIEDHNAILLESVSNCNIYASPFGYPVYRNFQRGLAREEHGNCLSLTLRWM